MIIGRLIQHGGDRNSEKMQPEKGEIIRTPNPTDGRFEVIFGRSDVCTVRVFDLFEKIVLEKTGKESLSIKAENWPTGIFTVLAFDANGFAFAQQKLAVQQ